VAEPTVWAVRVAEPAQRDTTAILRRSRKEFGEAGARRYATLIVQALRDIGADPERPGSKERPEVLVRGARTYHLWFSRSRVSGPIVKSPRHFLLYRLLNERVIEVGRILHDGCDLERHLPKQFRGSVTDE
jgi:toxin ParE1/3/4